jgi:hypothetical protein
MTLFRTTVLTAALVASAGAASAAQQCGATVHSRFGETRAYFQNSLAACRPDGYCSVVLALTDPTDQAAYAQQLRIARPTPGADHVVELVAVTPMSAGDGQPMSVSFGRRPIDLSGQAVLPNGESNLFRITDPATVSAIVSGARRSNGMRWTYQSQSGPAEAWFALGGVTRALTWIDCMGRR